MLFVLQDQSPQFSMDPVEHALETELTVSPTETIQARKYCIESLEIFTESLIHRGLVSD